MNIKSKVTEKTLKEIQKITGTKLTLGKLIWAIRQSDGDSQVVFAKKLKMKKQHLCDIEHERKSVSPSLAAEYAKRLGYSEEQFIRLALQDLVDREGLKVEVEIFSKRKPRDVRKAA
jgi:transcriptional regulator with XRE-family HTH domain